VLPSAPLLPECYPTDQIETNEMGGACGMSSGKTGAYRVLVTKTEDQRPLRRLGVGGRAILN
jgi:hypothetical protein